MGRDKAETNARLALSDVFAIAFSTRIANSPIVIGYESPPTPTTISTARDLSVDNSLRTGITGSYSKA